LMDPKVALCLILKYLTILSSWIICISSVIARFVSV
jgi:hypothetical protein